MFLLNSRLGLFSAANLRWHPFSRSYGVILPSSLTRVLSFVLGFSPRPPASVCGTGTLTIVSTFSCQRGFTCFPTCLRSFIQSAFLLSVLHYSAASRTPQALPSTCSCYPSVSVHHSYRWYRNLHLLSIAYDCCPRLRPRLTLGG